ncbi:MAG: DUF4268 domain-containing protein [Vicingus serpentipes]|nr:DUF4268 domain-containing protein [Vicingus serpentipes]
MYTKEEKKNINTEFWNSFGVYMKKHNKQYGRIRWVNYRTNIKDLYFRLNITQQKAVFSIELQHSDDGIRELFYEQFVELKTVLNASVGKELIWEDIKFNQFNHPVSCIYQELPNVSIYNKEDWQTAFQFFEKRMVGLHDFWIEFGEIFKQLEE